MNDEGERDRLKCTPTKLRSTGTRSLRQPITHRVREVNTCTLDHRPIRHHSRCGEATADGLPIVGEEARGTVSLLQGATDLCLQVLKKAANGQRIGRHGDGLTG